MNCASEAGNDYAGDISNRDDSDVVADRDEYDSDGDDWPDSDCDRYNQRDYRCDDAKLRSQTESAFDQVIDSFAGGFANDFAYHVEHDGVAGRSGFSFLRAAI
jgi:hypothetical protein